MTTESLIDEGESEDQSYAAYAAQSAGFLRDALAMSVPAVQTGFSIARTSAKLGFQISRQVLSAPQEIIPAVAGEDVPNPLAMIGSIIDTAEELTHFGMSLSEEITTGSIQVTNELLGLSGIPTGATARALTQYVESQRGLEGFETKEALLGIARLLGELAPLLEVSAIQLITGAAELSQIHAQHREERVAQLGDMAPIEFEQPLRDDLYRFMRFAAGAYGYHASVVLDVMKHADSTGSSASSDEWCIEALTGIETEHILLKSIEGGMYRPVHYVAVDHQSESVVVAIRGTMSFHDVLVDLVCEQDVFMSVAAGDEPLKGNVHKGFLASAKYLSTELREPVKAALEAHPSFRLVICGHSLGAGVASVLSLLWAEIPMFRERRLHTYAYGAPCSVCHEISQKDFTKELVTSVVIGDDIVSRLSLSTFKELQRSLIAMSPDLSVSEKAEMIKEVGRLSKEDKLFSAGKVILLHSEEYKGIPQVVDPVDTLHYIELSSQLFSVHTPNNYLDAVAQLHHD